MDIDKNFLGKEALLKRKTEVSCVTLLIDGPQDIDPWGREALYNETEDSMLGRLTSGGYSVHFQKSIGIGYVKSSFSEVGTKLRIKIDDAFWDAEIVRDSPYDPQNERIIDRIN